MSYEALNPRVSWYWKGTEFDLGTEVVDGAGVAFELVLSQGWYQRLLGWFSGTVTDDPDRGMPGVGEILGVCRFPKVRFTKQMPVMYFRDGCRQVSFREWLVEQAMDLVRMRRTHPSTTWGSSAAMERCLGRGRLWGGNFAWPMA